ncbi:MAG: pyridoxal phosphate-dependent aminotransferase [Leptospirillum sp.]
MTSWIREDIRTMKNAFLADSSFFTAGTDSAEGPFLLSPEVRSALSLKLSGVSLNRYPDHKAGDLVEALSGLWGVSSGSIHLGNGSDEILLNLFLATGGPVVCPVPSFSMYEVIAHVAGKSFIPVDMTPDLTIDVDAIERVVASQCAPGMLVVASPNNPTGRACSFDELSHLLQIAGRRGFSLLVDEAYFPYHQESVLDALDESENLLVLRTFSKMGLAAIRLGVLLAGEAVIREVEKVRLPYNLNSLTQEAALFLIRDHFDLLSEATSKIVRLREEMERELSEIPGIVFFPSRTNFLLLRLWPGSVPLVSSKLLENRIMVRDVSSHHPFLEDCIRISAGSCEDIRTIGTILRHFSEGARS